MRRWLALALLLVGCSRDPRQMADARRLLERAAARPVVKIELGTPALSETSEIVELTAMGPPIVPALIQLAERERPPLAAYAVMALGRIGDARARAPLERLRTRYHAKPTPDQWDFAVIGQCNLALTTLAR